MLPHEIKCLVPHSHSEMRSLQPREETDLLQVTQQERQSLASLPQVWGSWGFEEKLGGPPIHLCNSPNSRVTELALTVERLQDQNLEKDQLNKVLSEKLEALVRRGVGREGPDIG